MSGLNLSNPEWISKHGAAFDWTLYDTQNYEIIYRKIIHDRNRHRGRWFLFGIMTFVGAVSVTVSKMRSLYPDYFDESTYVFIGGLFFGFLGTLFLLILVSIIARLFVHWRTRVSLKSHMYQVRVGVDRSVLWLYKNETIFVFTSPDAFVEIRESGQYIVAFVNKLAAHVFPRDRLATSEEGRMVLNWFDTNWPNHEPVRSRREPIASSRGVTTVERPMPVWRRTWHLYIDVTGTETRADFAALLVFAMVSVAIGAVAGVTLDDVFPFLGHGRPELVIPFAVGVFFTPALTSSTIRRLRDLARPLTMVVLTILFSGGLGLLLLLLRPGRPSAARVPSRSRSSVSPYAASAAALALSAAAGLFLADQRGAGDPDEQFPPSAAASPDPALRPAATPAAVPSVTPLAPPLTLSGKDASDFLDRTMHPGPRPYR